MSFTKFNFNKMLLTALLSFALLLLLVPVQQVYAQTEEPAWLPYSYPYPDNIIDAGFMSLKKSPDNTPYLLYAEDYPPYRLAVKKYDGQNWLNVGQGPLSDGSTGFQDIAISSDNVPYVIYRDDDYGYKPIVKRLVNDNEWELVGNYPIIPTQVNLTAIALDNNDVPYIAFTDEAHGHHVSVMKLENDQWISVGNKKISQEGLDDNIFHSSNPQIVFDHSNTLHVAYTDSYRGNQITVKKLVGTNWVSVGEFGISDGEAHYPSISVNPDGKLYVSFFDVANGNKLTVMTYNGAIWEVVGQKAFSPALQHDKSWLIFEGNSPVVGIVHAQDYGVRNYYVFNESQTEPVTEQLHVSITNPTLQVGYTNVITLTVKDEQNNTMTSFNGIYPLTISGYSVAPNGEYGEFYGEELNSQETTINAVFTDGVAIASLVLYKAAQQELTFALNSDEAVLENSVTVTTTPAPFSALRQVNDIAVNGNHEFVTEPQVALTDQYGNTIDGNTDWYNFEMEKIDNGDWYVYMGHGISNNGVVTFHGTFLIAYEAVNNAQIRFVYNHNGQRITLDSNLFQIPVRMYAPHLDEIFYNGTGVELLWYSSGSQESYKIYKGKSINNLDIEVATVPGNALTYVDNTPSDGGIYFYGIKAYSGGSESQISNLKRVYVPASSVQPPSDGETEIEVEIEVKVKLKIKNVRTGIAIPTINIPINISDYMKNEPQ